MLRIEFAFGVVEGRHLGDVKIAVAERLGVPVGRAKLDLAMPDQDATAREVSTLGNRYHSDKRSYIFVLSRPGDEPLSHVGARVV